MGRILPERQRNLMVMGKGSKKKKNTGCKEYDLNNVSMVNVSKVVKVMDSGSSLLGKDSHSKLFLLCVLGKLFNSSII